MLILNQKKKNLLFLSGIKSVGREAISNIVKEREKNGKFKSLNDFIKEKAQRHINKLQLRRVSKSWSI